MYESTLVKMPHCWKSHVTAHMSQLMRLWYLLYTPLGPRPVNDFSIDLNYSFQVGCGPHNFSITMSLP